jgi:hypothetical protein
MQQAAVTLELTNPFSVHIPEGKAVAVKAKASTGKKRKSTSNNFIITAIDGGEHEYEYEVSDHVIVLATPVFKLETPQHISAHVSGCVSIILNDEARKSQKRNVEMKVGDVKRDIGRYVDETRIFLGKMEPSSGVGRSVPVVSSGATRPVSPVGIADDLLLNAKYVGPDGKIPAGAKKVAEWNNKRKVGWVTTLDVPIRQQFLVDGIGLGNDYTKVMSKIDLYENGGKYFWVHT